MLAANLAAATILGGLAAVWFFIERLRDWRQATSSASAVEAVQIDQLYTTAEQERDFAVDRIEYISERIAFYAPALQREGWRPLYRLCHLERGTHFYTADTAERDRAVEDFVYRDEGVLCQVSSRRIAGSVRLYRLFHRQRLSHFHATQRPERDRVVRVLGYRSEGGVGYVFDSPGPDLVPVFRLFRTA